MRFARFRNTGFIGSGKFSLRHGTTLEDILLSKINKTCVENKTLQWIEWIERRIASPFQNSLLAWQKISEHTLGHLNTANLSFSAMQPSIQYSFVVAKIASQFKFDKINQTNSYCLKELVNCECENLNSSAISSVSIWNSKLRVTNLQWRCCTQKKDAVIPQISWKSLWSA